MIVVHAKVNVKQGKKVELFAAAQALMAATRLEEGCISYVLLDDPSDETSCMFVEEWTDKAALQRHGTTPHIAEWRQQSAELVSGKSVLRLYEAEPTKL